MSVFEQTQPLNIQGICFDAEYTIRICCANGKEIITLYNLPADNLEPLILDAKELIAALFYVEYKADSLEQPLYIGHNGFCLSPYLFNTQYVKRAVKPNAAMVYRLGSRVGSIISRYTKKQDKISRRFVQTCVLMEYIPNAWLQSRSDSLPVSKDLSDNTDKQKEVLQGENKLSTPLDQKTRAKIANHIYQRYGCSKTSAQIQLTNKQKEFFIRGSFSYNGKCYGNWYDAFIDHVKKYESQYKGISRPSLKTHLSNQRELMSVNKQIVTLETTCQELRLKLSVEENGEELARLDGKLQQSMIKLSNLRFKRKEYNVRSDRQLNLLEDRFLLCTTNKSSKILESGEKDIATLTTIRNQLTEKLSQRLNAHKKMNGMIKVPFKGYRIDGKMVLEGDIDFKMDSAFINKLYSDNIAVFEGVVKLSFEMPDQKIVWHIPSYIESNQRRVDGKGLYIYFDQPVFDWLISQEQTRQNMIIQAVLNQHAKVVECNKNDLS